MENILLIFYYDKKISVKFCHKYFECFIVIIIYAPWLLVGGWENSQAKLWKHICVYNKVKI